MFESKPLASAELRGFVAALARLDENVDDAERIDQIRLLEELKSAAAAAQAKATTQFVASQRAAQVRAGVRGSEVGAGIASQVALAKRESSARARRYVGWAGILTTELPNTFTALQQGRITEWRAQIVARETAWLSADHRGAVDAALASRLESLGDRLVEAETKKLAYRLDPHGYIGRISRAESERRVSLRPAPDTMSVLRGFLPVAQGVSVLASLRRQADSLRSQGDERSRAQIMADTLVERVTGQTAADAVPVEVRLVMTDEALMNYGATPEEPAHIDGYGPVPADLARRIARTGATKAGLWLRRLFTHPETGELVAMESRRRHFDDGLADVLVVRDQVCRSPWCGAPIRHKDHVVAVEAGGETSEANGQGLCEACNYAKQAVGWRAQASGGEAGKEVEITTPTAHRYRSRPPPLPGGSPPGRLRPGRHTEEELRLVVTDRHRDIFERSRPWPVPYSSEGGQVELLPPVPVLVGGPKPAGRGLRRNRRHWL
jgi:hypothetical protein